MRYAGMPAGMWTLVMCPLAGLFVAGIGLLTGLFC